MALEIIRTPSWTAQENMDFDAHLLEDPSLDPKIHFYQWKSPSITYGYFTHPEKLLKKEALEAFGIDSGKRVTGGGVTLHFADLAFALFLPKEHPIYSLETLSRYKAINSALKRVYERLEKKEGSFYEAKATPLSPDCSCFCMAKPTAFDVMQGGHKIGGAAQRKTKNGILHHGTFSLTDPPFDVLAQIIRDPQVVEAMKEKSTSLFPQGTPLKEAQEKVESLLIEEFHMIFS